MKSLFKVEDIFSKERRKFFLIAGPCVIESESIIFEIAERLKTITEKLNIDLIFKSSFTKANRSSIESFRGPGIDKGLEILSRVKEKYSLPLLTDIHIPEEALVVSDIVDVIQIPAFLFRQTDLLTKAGETGKVVNIKKGQFGSANEMNLAADKVRSTGNDKVMLTERGTTFGYNNLVVDFRNFMEMKLAGYPVIYDVTHSLQRPAAEGNVSGGQPEYVMQMASAAIATGAVDGLFIETHPDPSKALSDGKSMLNLDELEKVLERCISIQNSLGK
ncbi:MAG: 3-deoxy-8-phosphooctulonate synthase [Candidatus Delongbacteria bacterium]|jgi:2-dehydro-3-deoxyphosphooctonate aldolase (KDO 8-P synthase)|nr:3-deoxy-8-phosphooctulonate synthase [Candidatus Delongbacteria bacterium]